MDKADKIMLILNDEYVKEVACYNKALEIMKKTRNPIKKIKCKRSLDMFSSRVAALRYAIIRIGKEVKD